MRKGWGHKPPQRETKMEHMQQLEQLMIENQEVLIRLKKGDPQDYTIEKIKEREQNEKRPKTKI